MSVESSSGPSALRRVEKLVITFLVDNSIEWYAFDYPKGRDILIAICRFGKLPPGFTHELRVHLSQDPPIDPLTGVPFLDLENYCCGEYTHFTSFSSLYH